MGALIERIREFFRADPRMWVVLVAAVGVTLLAVWGIYGGFSFQIGRFFAYGPEGPQTHLTCINNQCVSRPDTLGVGDECSTSADCGQRPASRMHASTPRMS